MRWFRWAASVLLNRVLPSTSLSTLVASPWGFTDGDTTVTVTTKDADNVAMAGVVWDATVETITIDQSDCFVALDKTVFDADGVDVVTVTITMGHLLDGEFVPLGDIAANQFSVAVSGTGNTVTQVAAPTGADGATTASFVSTVAGVKTVTVTACGVTLAAAVTTAEAGGSITPPASGDPFFEEDFAGTQFNPSNGFTWSGLNNTAVVSYGGFNCLRFRYEADAPGGDSTAEQRFTLGRDCTDLYVQYDILFPATYEHRNDSPNNNKFFLAWREVYGSGSGTWQPSFEVTADGSLGTRIRPMSSTQYRTAITSNAGTGWSNPDLNKQMIGNGGPITPGTWAQVRIQFSASSAADVQDGVMRMWIDGVLFAEATGVFRNYLDSPTDVALQRGYFMGWSNSGFDAQTDIYVKAVKFYDTDPSWS